MLVCLFFYYRVNDWVGEGRTRERKYQIGVSLCPSILRERCTGDCQPRARMSLFDLWVAERICVFCGYGGYCGVRIVDIVDCRVWIVDCEVWIVD